MTTSRAYIESDAKAWLAPSVVAEARQQLALGEAPEAAREEQAEGEEQQRRQDLADGDALVVGGRDLVGPGGGDAAAERLDAVGELRAPDAALERASQALLLGELALLLDRLLERALDLVVDRQRIGRLVGEVRGRGSREGLLRLGAPNRQLLAALELGEVLGEREVEAGQRLQRGVGRDVGSLLQLADLGGQSGASRVQLVARGRGRRLGRDGRDQGERDEAHSPGPNRGPSSAAGRTARSA
jgi:hypothetical protein